MVLGGLKPQVGKLTACFYPAAVQHSEVIIWEAFHGYFSSSLRKLKIVMAEHGFCLNPWQDVAYNWCQ